MTVLANSWARLIKAATAAVERPANTDAAREFKHCADVCFHRGVMPGGSHDREAAKPFMALTGFGRAWCALPTGARRENADAVLAAIEGCAAQLDGQVVPAPVTPADQPRRFRADLDG